MKEECGAEDITISLQRGTPNTSVAEGVYVGLEFQRDATRCSTNRNPIPFCVRIIDTTPCDPGDATCYGGTAYAHQSRIIFVSPRGALEPRGIEKLCGQIFAGAPRTFLTYRAYDNSIRDSNKNALHILMLNPVRVLTIEIMDND